MRAHVLVAYACAGALSLAGSNAGAQVPTDSAKAEALFREANRLLAKSLYPEACAKFAESKRLEPGIGVTLYLGDCYERVGRTASAWAEFSAAQDAAHLVHDSRARLARDRAAHLEARLSKVVLVVAPGAEVFGLEMTQDGAAIGRAQWGIALPVDPGDHHFGATAPGHRAWAQAVHVADGPITATVDVPALPLDPPPIAPVITTPAPAAQRPEEPPLAQPERSADGSPQRVLGLATLGAGIAAVGAGTIFGLAAKSKVESSNANGQCNASDHCDAQGLATRSDGMRDATISTIAFAVGAGALVGGSLLYLMAPQARAGAPSPVGISGTLGPGGARVIAAVRF